MSLWKINNQEPETLGISGFQIRDANLADGSLTFTAARPFDADPLFAYREIVTLTGPGNTVRWRGPRIWQPSSASAESESQQYTIASPWFWLEHTLYLQEWTVTGPGGTVSLGRCILGVAGIDGRLTIGETVAAVINYAASVGCPIQAGTIEVDGLFPVEEVKGLMCGEVIRRVLRWAPDTVGWWEYAGANAVFQLRRRSALTEKTLAVGAAPLEKVGRIDRRDDLIPSQVVLAYERVDTLDGVPKRSVALDVAPPGANGKAPFALLYTIPLAGGSVTNIKQPVEVQTIQVTSLDPNGSVEAKRYWGRLCGLVGKATGGDTPEVTFFKLSEDPGAGYFARELANPSGFDGSGAYQLEDPSNPASDKIRLNAALPRELIGGAIASWMSGVTYQKQLIRMKLSYTPVGTSKSIKPTIFTVGMVATDATNRIYSKVDSVEFPEEPASGLAAKMLEVLSVPQYQGEVSLLDVECGGAIGLGDCLNLSNTRAEYAAMRAVVQEVEEDIDNGRTVIRFGPPEHLGPQDQIELQRCDRRAEGNTGNGNGNAGSQSTGDL